MRNAFLLIELANSHAENIRNTKVHPRGHKQAEDQTSNARKEHQLCNQGLQKYNEYDEVARGHAQETPKHNRPARIYNISTWQERRQKRETQTQRIQPLPEREDDARNEHDRRRQSLEGKRQLVIDRLFNATDRPRLAITDTTVLAIQPPSGGLVRGCISSCHRPTHFLESRSNGIIRDS